MLLLDEHKFFQWLLPNHNKNKTREKKKSEKKTNKKKKSNKKPTETNKSHIKIQNGKESITKLRPSLKKNTTFKSEKTPDLIDLFKEKKANNDDDMSENLSKGSCEQTESSK